MGLCGFCRKAETKQSGRCDESLEELEDTVKQLLDQVHTGLYNRAKQNLEDHTRVCLTLEEGKQFMEAEGGFAKTMWCGDLACEVRMKEEAGVTSRCMPLEQEKLYDVCPICGKPAKSMIIWGKAY